MKMNATMPLHTQRMLRAFSLGLVATAAIPAHANIVRVDAGTGADTPACGSEAAPCRTLQQAVNLAQSGDTIRLAQGVHTGTGSQVVALGSSEAGKSKNLTLVGGYKAGDWETPDPDPGATLLDGQNARRVIQIVSVDAIHISLQNLTIRNGLVNESNPIPNTGEFSGGGLLCRNDNPNTPLFVSVDLSNVAFRDNRVQISGNTSKAASGGGASFYFRCSANLDKVTFDGNLVQGGNAPSGDSRGAHALGGGLFLSGGFGTEDRNAALNARDVAFVDNKAIAGSGGDGDDNGFADALGGGAALQLCKVQLDGITAGGNQATGGQGSSQGGTASGGALFFELNTGTVQIARASLNDNRVTGGASAQLGGTASGGALMATDSVLDLNRMTAIGNSSIGGAANDAGDAGGGALYFTKAKAENTIQVSARNLIVARNRAEAGAGGNRFGGGGGIFSQDANLTLVHATLADNGVLDTMQGPALITLHNFANSKVSLQYGIVAGHTGSDIFGNPRAPLIAQKAGDTLDLSHVLFHQNSNDFETGKPYGGQPGVSGAILHSSNELSGDPAFENPAGGDYHLRPASAAVDRAVGSTVPDDVDGELRPHAALADVGADEYYLAAPNLAPVKSFSPGRIDRSHNQVTYSLILNNSGRAAATQARLTDPLPGVEAPLSVAPIQANCTAGTCTLDGQGLTWTGEIPANSQISIQYAVRVNIPDSFDKNAGITNSTALLEYAEGEDIPFTATGNLDLVLFYYQYLPLLNGGQ